MPDPLTLQPIGVIHTPFPDRASAPRQTYAARDVPGTIVLEPGRDFEHALADVDGWEFLWVLYWFHQNQGWRPKVLPPRSKVRRGVFGTRSPHRPCPIGLSVVRLERVVGLTVHVRGVDMIDGSPVLDLKPYVAVADAIPDAGAGWLAAPDPIAPFSITWSPLAEEQLAWLAGSGIDLRGPVEATLSLGPEPHPYRRIRKDGAGFRLALKEWRISFRVDGERCLLVERIDTGYGPRQLLDAGAPGLDVHRAFAVRFGEKSSPQT
jgi:tRNA-Thr(GGU) m(6)t(6)A37 methyltransferase TsaA